MIKYFSCVSTLQQKVAKSLSIRHKFHLSTSSMTSCENLRKFEMRKFIEKIFRVTTSNARVWSQVVTRIPVKKLTKLFVVKAVLNPVKHFALVIYNL